MNIDLLHLALNAKTLSADVIFVVNGQHVYAHRCILHVCASEPIRNMFKVNSNFKVLNSIEITEDVSVAALQLFIVYLYTNGE
jgi:hypothetical protein